MARRVWLLVALLVAGACSDRGSPAVADPIPGIPESQQRTAGRAEFDWRWPFTVGTGTLGCDAKAVLFRADGVSYALNDAAKSRGFAPVDPIWLTQSPRPSNPLPRIPQDQRMQIFVQSVACDRQARGNSADLALCRQRLREARGLSDAELVQIDAEGLERAWPPLPPRHVSLGPIIDEGLRLCRDS